METKAINIAEILKDCPAGMELYSPCYGKILFNCVDEHIRVLDSDGYFRTFNAYGKIHLNGECMLFPSKDQRDWSKFKQQIKPPFEIKRVDKGGHYYFIGNTIEVFKNIDYRDYDANYRLNHGNYFNTKKQAEYAAGKVKKLLLSLRKEENDEQI